MLEDRIKWIRASIDVSNSRNDSYYRKIKGAWKAFWLAPKLEQNSTNIKEFKDTYK
jgi:hypothetical protein